MGELELGNIVTVFGEPNVQVRRTVADSLRHHGYRNIRDTDQVEEIRTAIERGLIDVLICDIDLGGTDLCDFIRRIRHDEIGLNPYMVTIALTNSLEPSVIRRIIDSGADDIVTKPLSMNALVERLDRLASKRKGFIVTTDYIGPDRRREARPGTQEIPVLDVPNPIQLRALGEDAEVVLHQAIEATNRIVNEQKMERHAYQISYLVDRIVPRCRKGMLDEETLKLVNRIVSVAEDLVRRMAGTERAHVSDLGGSIIEVASAINGSPMLPRRRDVRLLAELGPAIKQAFSADERTIAAVHDISTSLEQRSRT